MERYTRRSDLQGFSMMDMWRATRYCCLWSKSVEASGDTVQPYSKCWKGLVPYERHLLVHIRFETSNEVMSLVVTSTSLPKYLIRELSLDHVDHESAHSRCRDPKRKLCRQRWSSRHGTNAERRNMPSMVNPALARCLAWYRKRSPLGADLVSHGGVPKQVLGRELQWARIMLHRQ